MTDYQKYINALRKCAKEHEGDRTFTGQIIVSNLCRETANLLEELEQEPFKPMVEIDLYSVIKQKYIEREVLDKIREEIKVMTSNRGFLSCSVDHIHEEIDKVFDKYKCGK